MLRGCQAALACALATRGSGEWGRRSPERRTAHPSEHPALLHRRRTRQALRPDPRLMVFHLLLVRLEALHHGALRAGKGGADGTTLLRGRENTVRVESGVAILVLASASLLPA
jgi:hypothetical protein